MALSLSLPLILSASFVASASPGPATLAIADTSMGAGRRAGLSMAFGVATGSLVWSIAAAMSLAAVMASRAWAVEALRYLGAAYLMILALKSARNAAVGPAPASTTRIESAPARAYFKGLAMHVTNPKPILFFGSVYTLGISSQTSYADLAIVIALVAVQATIIFLGYAWLFSSACVARTYRRLRRGFEAAFALLFAGASIKILYSRFGAS